MSATDTDTTYNGYANYETWNLMLWMHNEEDLYNALHGNMTVYARCGASIADIQYIFRSAITRKYGQPITPDGVSVDDDKVDWREIKKCLMDDFAI